MNTIARIEQALDIKLAPIQNPNRQAATIVDCTLTESKIRDAVASGKIEWQNANDPSCGNEDDVLYLYMPANIELDLGEVFIGIYLPAAELFYC